MCEIWKGQLEWDSASPEQSQAEILEKRFLCPRCALLAAMPICPVTSRCQPTLDFSMCPQICVSGAHQSTQRVTLSSLPAWLTTGHFLYIFLSQIRQLPVMTKFSYSSGQRNFLRCESEHITRPCLVGLSLCWGPAVFPLGLCTQFVLPVSLPMLGRMLNLPEVFSHPSPMFPKAL